MKPLYEDIHPSFGSSFTFRWFTEAHSSNLPYWHFHPEYEIVYVSNGRGQRKIGEHLSTYEDGDLTFLGPNLPHLGFAQELYDQHIEIVIQMKENFLGNDFFDNPEMQMIGRLFQRAKSGLIFYGNTKKDIGHRLQKMIEYDNFSKMLELLMILQIMAYSDECEALNINNLSTDVKPQDHLRMSNVYEYVEQHYHNKISIEDVADIANMTPQAFCRFFKKLTHKTFIDFLNEYRVAHACRLLSDSPLSISGVSYEAGFNNLSHFNKHFKQITGQTPSSYRQHVKSFVQAPIKG